MTPARIGALALSLLAFAPGIARAQRVEFPPPLELRVPKAPTVATGDGRSFLVYELHVTNFSPAPITVERLEVLDAGTPNRVLLSLADTALGRALGRPGVAPPPALAERGKLGGGLRAVAFLWVPMEGPTRPSRVQHRLTLVQGSGDSARTQTLVAASVPVASDVAVVGPPLRGTGWLTANGPAANTGHRRALLPVDGLPYIAQRFAIDYVKVDSAGSTFRGDREKNASYHAQGADALAVADGIVVVTKDSIPENVPGVDSRAVPITMETVGGNHVIIDIGQGRYAFYAHLQPGSLRVKKGDRVRRGQVLGLVGNSGNSTEPHLHFHISDSPSPLGSEGIPYAHDSFDIVGRCTGTLTGCSPVSKDARRREIPMANVIVSYPR